MAGGEEAVKLTIAGGEEAVKRTMAGGEEPVNLTMAGGDGPNSYRHNSSNQRALLEVVKEKINKAISTNLDLEKLDISSSNTCKIADFGCSVGPNTFIAVQNIVDAVSDLAGQKEAGRNLEFQVFFNDQASNDFNTVFRTLPTPLGYFAAGVPGSFFSQVLPTGSLHVARCSNALQSLSKLPEGILDRESMAWNGGSIHCTGFVKEVKEAYFEQFKIDTDAFLSARAREMVPGGLMLLLGSSLPDGIIFPDTMRGKLLDIAGACLYDFANSGKISIEDLERFNLPFYPTNISDFKQVIEQNGCYTIEIMERVSHANVELPLDAKFLASAFRSSLGEAIANRFGTDFTDGYFMESFVQQISQNLRDLADSESSMQYFILLRRN